MAMTFGVENVYYELVKAGRRTIKQVPVKVRAQVQALLDADTQQQAQPNNQ